VDLADLIRRSGRTEATPDPALIVRERAIVAIILISSSLLSGVPGAGAVVPFPAVEPVNFEESAEARIFQLEESIGIVERGGP
jgi:hypothetical protein